MTFRRQGLGYIQPIPYLAAVLHADRIKRASDGLHVELTVESAASGTTHTGHLFRGRANLSSLVAIKTLATDLEKRVKADWREILGEFARSVLEAESVGEPVVLVGRLPPREALKYLIFPLCPADDATILFGDGEAGKSFFALGCAFAVKTGIQIIPHMNAHAGVPLYLDWETNQYEIDGRMKMIARAQGMEPPEIPYLRMAGPLTDHLERIAGVVADRGVTFVVVDSFEMAMAGGENRDANDSVIRFFTALRFLRATCLVLDHVNKVDADSEKGAKKPYGSVYKHDMARSTWEMRKTENTRLLTNRKLSNDTYRGVLAYEYVFRDGGMRFDTAR